MSVFHTMRYDDANLERFGEIYFLTIFLQAIKEWHPYPEMMLNDAVSIDLATGRTHTF